LTILTSNTSNY